jgi:hypothetical protein
MAESPAFLDVIICYKPIRLVVSPPAQLVSGTTAHGVALSYDQVSTRATITRRVSATGLLAGRRPSLNARSSGSGQCGIQAARLNGTTPGSQTLKSISESSEPTAPHEGKVFNHARELDRSSSRKVVRTVRAQR